MVDNLKASVRTGETQRIHRAIKVIKHKRLNATLAILRILPRFPGPREVLGKMYTRACTRFGKNEGRCSAGKNTGRIFPGSSQDAETGCI